MHAPFGDASPGPPVAFMPTVGALPQGLWWAPPPQKQLYTPSPPGPPSGAVVFEQSAASVADVTWSLGKPPIPAVPPLRRPDKAIECIETRLDDHRGAQVFALEARLGWDVLRAVEVVRPDHALVTRLRRSVRRSVFGGHLVREAPVVEALLDIARRRSPPFPSKDHPRSGRTERNSRPARRPPAKCRAEASSPRPPRRHPAAGYSAARGPRT